MKEKHGYNKITAKWKRVISRILILVMVMTTTPMTEVAYAAELPVTNSIESTDENLVDSAVDSSDSANEASSDSAEESLAENPEEDSSNNPEENPAESQEEGSDEQKEESSEAASESLVEASEEGTEEAESSSDNSATIKEATNTTGEGVDVILGCESTATEDLYLRGTMNNWETDIMAEKSNGLVFAKINLTPGTQYEYKFATSNWWSACHSGDNHTVTINEAETYYPIINGKQVTFRYESSSSAVYLAGTMNGLQVKHQW